VLPSMSRAARTGVGRGIEMMGSLLRALVCGCECGYAIAGFCMHQ
jgi:hypothetical protein